MELKPLPKKTLIIIWSACIAVFIFTTVFSGLFLYDVRENAQNAGNAAAVNWALSERPNSENAARVRNLTKLSDWETEKKQIEIAREADPENSFVDLQALRLLSSQAFTVKFTDDGDTHAILQDEILAEEAVKAFKNLVNKKEYNSFLLEEYLELKSENKTFSGLLNEISIAFSFFFPELSSIRNFTKFYVVYKNPDEDELKLRAREIAKFSKNLFKNSQSILEVLVAGSISNIVCSHLLLVNKDFFQEEIKELTYLYQLSKSIKGNYDIDPYIPQLDSLSRMTLPAFAAPADFREKLTNSRRLEYAYFDSIVFAVMPGYVLFLAFSMILVISRWQFTSEPHKPFLILPEKKYAFKSLFISIFIITVFLTICHFLPSRKFGMSYFQNPFMYACEMACFFLAAFIIPYHILLDGLREKLQEQYDYPEKNKGIYFLLFVPILVMFSSKLFYSSDLENNFIMAIPCLLPFALLLFFGFKIFRALLQKKYAYWHGASARLLIVSLATFSLLIAFLPMTVFKWRQAYHYENDRLIRVASNEGYISTYAEADLVIEIKSKIDSFEDLSEIKRKAPSTPSRIIYFEKEPPEEKETEGVNEDRSRSRRSRLREIQKKAQDKADIIPSPDR